MYHIFLKHLIIVLLTCCFGLNAQESISEEKKGSIEQLAMAFLSQTKTPGLSIAVSKNERMIYANGFGYANVEEKVAMDSSTRLRTASVAKVITATALGRLATQGKLDFDAPISDYVPYIDDTYAQLTTRQLAGHTAGMAHRPKGERYKKKQYDNIQETVELMNTPLLFEPDTDYRYSTHAYNLLAAVIEGASGETYTNYMNNFIFKPLGMIHTAAERIDKLNVQDAQLYYIKNNKAHKEKITNDSYKLPGAAFRSTPTDLVKMMSAYESGFISEEMVLEMFKSHQLKDGTNTKVGIGWRSSVDPFGNKVIEHAGNWRGARTVIVHFPDENLNISLMVNATCSVLIEETAHILAQMFRNDEVKSSPLNSTNQEITVEFNSDKGPQVYPGTFSFKSDLGALKAESKNFLKSNPMLYLGSGNDYALATSFGLLYVHIEHTSSLDGQVFAYYSRLSENPRTEEPLVSFK